MERSVENTKETKGRLLSMEDKKKKRKSMEKKGDIAINETANVDGDGDAVKTPKVKKKKTSANEDSSDAVKTPKKKTTANEDSIVDSDSDAVKTSKKKKTMDDIGTVESSTSVSIVRSLCSDADITTSSNENTMSSLFSVTSVSIPQAFKTIVAQQHKDTEKSVTTRNGDKDKDCNSHDNDNDNEDVEGKGCDANNEEETKVDDYDPKRIERTIFVGHLPSTTTPKEIKTLFRPYGVIESVRIRSIAPADSKTSKKVAYITRNLNENYHSFNAYVVFGSKESSKAALVLNNSDVGGNHIRVDRVGGSNMYDPKKSVFIGNLAFESKEEDVRAFFENHGCLVEGVRLVRDPKTMLGKGFGFVLFDNQDHVLLALNQNGESINGRAVRVFRSSKNPALLKGKHDPQGVVTPGVKPFEGVRSAPKGVVRRLREAASAASSKSKPTRNTSIGRAGKVAPSKMSSSSTKSTSSPSVVKKPRWSRDASGVAINPRSSSTKPSNSGSSFKGRVNANSRGAPVKRGGMSGRGRTKSPK